MSPHTKQECCEKCIGSRYYTDEVEIPAGRCINPSCECHQQKSRSEFIEKVDKMDAEIMDWFYECCRINFGVETMMQDSIELREIIRDNLQEYYDKK